MKVIYRFQFYVSISIFKLFLKIEVHCPHIDFPTLVLKISKMNSPPIISTIEYRQLQWQAPSNLKVVASNLALNSTVISLVLIVQAALVYGRVSDHVLIHSNAAEGRWLSSLARTTYAQVV